MYIYIYIYREREIYIHIDREREREREKERERERGREGEGETELLQHFVRRCGSRPSSSSPSSPRRPSLLMVSVLPQHHLCLTDGSHSNKCLDGSKNH